MADLSISSSLSLSDAPLETHPAPVFNSSQTAKTLPSATNRKSPSSSTSPPSSIELAKTMAAMGKLNLCNMREAMDSIAIPYLISESEIWTINGEVLQIIVPDEKGGMSNGMTLKVVFKEGTAWVNHSPSQLGRQVLVALALYHHGVLEKTHEIARLPDPKLQQLAKFRRFKETNTGCYAESCAIISHITLLWRGEAVLMKTFSKREVIEKAPYTDVLISSASEKMRVTWKDLHIMYSEACAAASDKWQDCYRLNGMAAMIGSRWKENLVDLLTDLKKQLEEKKPGTQVQVLYRTIALACLTHRNSPIVSLTSFTNMDTTVKKPFVFNFSDPCILASLPSTHKKGNTWIKVPNIFLLAVKANHSLQQSGSLPQQIDPLKGFTFEEIWQSKRRAAAKLNALKKLGCPCCINVEKTAPKQGNKVNRLECLSFVFWTRRAYLVQSAIGWIAARREKEHLAEVLASGADYLSLDSLDQGPMGFTIQELIKALVEQFDKVEEICGTLHQDIVPAAVTCTHKLCPKCEVSCDFFFREVKNLHFTLVVETEALIQRAKANCARKVRLADGPSSIPGAIIPGNMSTGEALAAHTMETSINKTGGTSDLFAPAWQNQAKFWEVPQELVDKIAALRADSRTKVPHGEKPCLEANCLVCHLRACEGLFDRYTQDTPEMNLQGLEVAIKHRLNINSSKYGTCEVHASRLVKALRAANECIGMDSEDCCNSCCSWAYRTGGGSRMLCLERSLAPEAFKAGRPDVFGPGWKEPPMEAKRAKQGHSCPQLNVPVVTSVILAPPPPITTSEAVAIRVATGPIIQKVVRPILPPLPETELDTDPKIAAIVNELRSFELALSALPAAVKEHALKKIFGSTSPSITQMEGKSASMLVSALRETHVELFEAVPEWLAEGKLQILYELGKASESVFIGLVYNLQAGLILEEVVCNSRLDAAKNEVDEASTCTTEMPWFDILNAYKASVASSGASVPDSAAPTPLPTGNSGSEKPAAAPRKKRAGGKKKREQRARKEKGNGGIEEGKGAAEASGSEELNLVMDSNDCVVNSLTGENYGKLLEFARHCAAEGGGKMSASLEAKLQSLQSKIEGQNLHRKKLG